MLEKGYFWNPAAFSCKNVKYTEGIIRDSVVTSNEIIETTKNTAPTKTLLPKCTLAKFYILRSCLLITIALLIAVSISFLLEKISTKINIYYHFITPANQKKLTIQMYYKNGK